MGLSHARKQGADPIGIEARFQSESDRAFERNESAFSIGMGPRIQSERKRGFDRNLQSSLDWLLINSPSTVYRVFKELPR
jgi:hypothetical protein